jgi:signal peptidase I
MSFDRSSDPPTDSGRPDDGAQYSDPNDANSRLAARESGAEREINPHPTSEPTRRRGGLFREVLETVLIAIVIFVAVRALVLNFRVDGNSMLPNLQNGEMLLVNRNAYETFDLYTLIDWVPGVEHAEAKEFSPFSDPDRGDIVVFDPPVQSSKPYIKRVIALPGETVETRDGDVYIDGKQLEEPYVESGITDCNRAECEAVVVPEDHIFVLGDNRQNSSDSRVFGPVPIDSVQGKAWVVYWPLDEIGSVGSANYPDE